MPTPSWQRPMVFPEALDWHDLNTHPRKLPLSPPIDADIVDILSEPYVCFLVNERWLPHVLGQISNLLQPRAWANQPDESIQQIERMLAGIATCGVIGECTLLRQNPSNPCLLEQSQDGGATWTTAFNFGLCASGESSTTEIVNKMILQTEINNYVENNRNTWNANPTINNFAPTLIYNGTDEDLNRDLALCYASQAIIKIIIETGLESYGTGLAADVLSLVVGVVGVVGGFLIGGVAGAVVGAVVTSEGMKIFLKSEAALDEPVFRSLEADFACAIYNAVKDDNLSRENFQTALSVFDTYPADYYAGIIQALFDDLDVWLTFLDLAKSAMEYQEYNLPIDCPCENVAECIAAFNGIGILESHYELAAFVGNTGYTPATGSYDAVNDRINGVYNGSVSDYRMWSACAAFTSPTNWVSIDTIEIAWETNNEVGGGYWTNAVDFYDDRDALISSATVDPGGIGNNGTDGNTGTRTIDTIPTGTVKIRVWARCRRDDDNGYARITSITVCGTASGV